MSPKSILEGEKIGDTVVLELKNDVEKLSQENQNLKESNAATTKKCDDLAAEFEKKENQYSTEIK